MTIATHEVPDLWGPRTAKNAASSTDRMYTTHGHLPEEHRMVYEMCRKFADEELAPNAREWDLKHQFPKDAVAKLVSTFVIYLSIMT